MIESSDQPSDGTSEWRSGNPPWGILRALIVDGDYAVLLDDLNSDYREVELSLTAGSAAIGRSCFLRTTPVFRRSARLTAEGGRRAAPRMAGTRGHLAVNARAPSSA